jgi:two-component system phosphate regulon sensor histidine kinase PhoR
MINQDEEFLGIDKNSDFSLRVLILSIPAGLIFLILALLEVLPFTLAGLSYICVLFFNTVFLMPLSAEIQKIKKYLERMATGENIDYLLKDMTEQETKNLTEIINSMHRFWVDKTEILENRTLSDAAVLDTLPDPLIMVNKECMIIGANLAARRLFSTDLSNKSFLSFIDDDKVIDAIGKVLNKSIRQIDLNICLKQLKDKPKFYLRINDLPWFAKGDIVAVISFYDLNKVLKFEQMHQDFVANASHELRTPLSVISGFIETLQTSAKNDEKAREKFLNIMQEQTFYMSQLIDNLLSLSKIDLSLTSIPEGKVSINPIIREINDALQLKLQEKHLSIKTSFARLPKITGDNSQITQVLRNIIDNAIKYADNDTIISVKTSKVTEVPRHPYYDVATGNAIEISISNYGVTINKNDLNRLTERFYRLQEHKNRNIKGTGLGLSIASQIIKRHKGNIIITSEDNLTTFKVYLPTTLEN